VTYHIAHAAGEVKRPTILDLEFRRHVRALHRRGERAIAELLLEFNADPFDLLGKLRGYAGIDPVALDLTGGDRFPPSDGNAA
jgi:hypothetical protein